MDSLLSIRKFGASFGKKTILSRVDLEIEDRGVMVLMGPSGTGKSTLLRSLAGLNDASSIFSSWGEAIYAGEKLGKREHPILVEQKPGLLASSTFENIIHTLQDRSLLNQSQQMDLVHRILQMYGLQEIIPLLNTSTSELDAPSRRIIAILAAIINSPELVMIDEPTTGIEDCDIGKILGLIKQIGKDHSVLVVLHNQQHAQIAADKIALLAGGVIQESNITKHFFNSPVSNAARDFIRTGSCAVPSPDAKAEHLDENIAKTYKPVHHLNHSQKPVPYGPQGFKWLFRDKLAATPRPGLFRDVDDDIRALLKVKITHLVSLEEKLHYQASDFIENGIQVIQFPIADMKAPALENTKHLLLEIQKIIRQGGIVAVHCRAGLGRTGTILASFLISTNVDRVEAIHTIRALDPRMIQTTEQEDFLHEYAKDTQDNHYKIIQHMEM